MKYWNKQKRYRDCAWVVVKIDYDHRVTNWEGMKRWCQQQSSPYKFYSGTYTRNVWYFEDRQDAVAFKLKWVGR